MQLSCQIIQELSKDGHSPTQSGSNEQLGPKFRFGPLVWRSSRERNKRGTKAARNAKCNSGDSGVQVFFFFFFFFFFECCWYF